MNVIRFTVPQDVRWDAIALRQFSESVPYYLAGARVLSCSGRELAIAGVDRDDSLRILLEAEVLVRSIGAELRDSEEVLLYESRPPRSAHGDPMAQLLSSGYATRTGVGRFSYSGTLLKLLNCLDQFLGRFAADLGADAHLYPTTVSTESLIRSGYLNGFPQHALFVAPVGYSARQLLHVGRCTDVAQLDAGSDGGSFGPHDQVLAPTVCYHCFETLKGSALERFQCVTAVNPCHRHEVLGGDSLARLHTFRMREVIAFSDGPYVARVLDQLLEATQAALNRWQISYRVTTASDAFFAGAPGNKIYFQSAFALKRELRIRTDFDDQWIAVASFNNHQKSLTRVFSIQAGDSGSDSGCVGWGYERLAYALMSQLGVDINAWPEAVRTELRI